MSNSLLYGGLELTTGTYSLMLGGRLLGDPQAVTQAVQAQLTNGSVVSGSFTDNRPVSLQILIRAVSSFALSQAHDTLLVQLSAQSNTLQWWPDGALPVIFDTWKGQAATQWDGRLERQFARIVTISFPALPFGRSPTRTVINGLAGASPIQLANFQQATEYTYAVPTNGATIPSPPLVATYSAPPANTAYDNQWNEPGNPTFNYFAASMPVTGNAYAEQPAGGGSMRVDLNWWAYAQEKIPTDNTNTVFATYDLGPATGRIGPIAVTANLAANLTVQLVQAAAVTVAAWLTLTDSHGASQHFQMVPGTGSTIGCSLAGATIDLTTIRFWTLDLYSYQLAWLHGSPYAAGLVSTNLVSLAAYPTSSSLTTTAHGAVYKLPSVIGSALTPATAEIDRGGSSTMTGILVYRGPSGTAAGVPSLLALASGAGTTIAPSAFNGTYRMLLLGGSTGGTITITQNINGTAVATTTLTSVAVGTAWLDCGDVTLPLLDMPADVTNATYTVSGATGSSEAVFLDTRGFLVWVPTFSADPYVWVDEASALNGLGGVWSGGFPDRSDAISILGGAGVQLNGGLSVDPGDNYITVVCPDGAPSNISLSYAPRWQNERAAS